MSGRFLEVTYRNGKPFAAYLYLPRMANDFSARTEERGAGLLVDFSSDNRPIGVEITAPSRCSVDAINEVMNSLGIESIDASEIQPLRSAA